MISRACRNPDYIVLIKSLVFWSLIKETLVKMENSKGAVFNRTKLLPRPLSLKPSVI